MRTSICEIFINIIADVESDITFLRRRMGMVGFCIMKKVALGSSARIMIYRGKARAKSFLNDFHCKINVGGISIDDTKPN